MENLKELKTLLESIVDSLQRILTLEREKTEILQSGSVEQLNELMNTEQALVMECASAEKQRNSICLGLEAATISELTARYPEAKEHLAPLHDRLVNLVSEIKKVSSVNIKLIDVRLNIIKFMTSQFGVSEDNVTYGRNAKAATTAK